MSNHLSESTNEEIAIGTAEGATESAEVDTGLEAPHHWFQSLTRAEKRFHVLFYALAGLTGLLVVQLVWQIAAATAP